MSKLSAAVKNAKHEEPKKRGATSTSPLPDHAEFIVPATDGSKRPAEHVHFKMQPGHLREITNIIWSRYFPYKNPSDLLRHAVQRHLAWLRSLGVPMTSTWGQTDAIIELIREQQAQLQFTETLRRLEETTTAMAGLGERSEAKRLVAKIKIEVMKMPEGRWKQKWLKELKTKLGYLEQPALEVEFVKQKLLAEKNE
jgi:hypothetical protein